MNYIESSIKQEKRLGNQLIAFWTKERERIYIYCLEKDMIIGSCSNTEYVNYCEKYDLDRNISTDYETLSYFLGDENILEEVI